MIYGYLYAIHILGKLDFFHLCQYKCYCIQIILFLAKLNNIEAKHNLVHFWYRRSGN